MRKVEIHHLTLHHNCRSLNGKLWKEKEMRKVGIHHLTIQSSFLQLFERETWKEKWQEKSWNPRSYHPKFIIAVVWMGKLWKEKDMKTVGVLDLSIQSSFLQLFEKETRKEHGMNKLESTILPSKVHFCSCLRRKLWKKNEVRRFWKWKEKKNTFWAWASWSRFWNILSRGSEDIPSSLDF